MAVHKTIELMGASPKSWEDAVQKVVTQASKSVKCIRSVWVKDMSCEVDSKGKLKGYRVNCKLTFEVK
ncbi:MAG: dodecin family protein [Pseudomonadota bacterium]